MFTSNGDQHGSVDVIESTSNRHFLRCSARCWLHPLETNGFLLSRLRDDQAERSGRREIFSESRFGKSGSSDEQNRCGSFAVRCSFQKKLAFAIDFDFNGQLSSLKSANEYFMKG